MQKNAFSSKPWKGIYQNRYNFLKVSVATTRHFEKTKEIEKFAAEWNPWSSQWSEHIVQKYGALDCVFSEIAKFSIEVNELYRARFGNYRLQRKSKKWHQARADVRRDQIIGYVSGLSGSFIAGVSGPVVRILPVKSEFSKFPCFISILKLL